MKFKYLKGSEADFDGAPEWCTEIIHNSKTCYFAENFDYMCKILSKCGKDAGLVANPTAFTIIAQREPIADVDANATINGKPLRDYGAVERVIYKPIEPEKLGHGLDCEECKPINTGDCVIMDGKRYIVGEESIPCINMNIRNHSGEPIQIEKSENDGDTIIQTIISGIKKPGDDYRKLVQSINKSRLKDKSALNVTVTAEEMKPTMQKLIDDFTSQPLELSFYMINGAMKITDQFGRELANPFKATTRNYFEVAELAIDVKYRNTK